MERLKILILGGTHFLGRHLVEAALDRGHEVTLFNRGQRNPDLFPDVERLHGDRDGNLESLKGRQWDAVIDPSGYLPRVVAASASLLADAVEHYTFISTISVYADPSIHRLAEDGQLATMADESLEDVRQYYGPLKALCEQVVTQAMGGRSLLIRPGLIVGPYDPTDRFTYWPVRAAQGGEILAPGEPSHPVQVIHGRDLAEWSLTMVEQRETGTYNATGPDTPYTLSHLLERCLEVTGGNGHLTWVDDPFLLAHEIKPWIGLPLWLPGEEATGLMNVDVGRALAKGLHLRPLEQTIAETLAWHQSRPAGTSLQVGLTPQREAELLAAWRGGDR